MKWDPESQDSACRADDREKCPDWKRKGVTLHKEDREFQVVFLKVIF